MLSLKYIADTPKDGNPTAVLFWIDKQDDRAIIFTASNGWTIRSENYPEVNEFYGNVLYVRGDDKSRDNDVMGCSWKVFEHIIAAVQEYNQSLDLQAVAESGFTPVRTIH